MRLEDIYEEEEPAINVASFKDIEDSYEMMRAFGKSGLREALAETLNQGKASNVGPGCKLLDQATPNVYAALEEAHAFWKSKRKGSNDARLGQLMDDLGVTSAAILGCSVVLNAAARTNDSRRHWAAVRRELADQLKLERDYQLVRKLKPEALKWAMKTINRGGPSKRHAEANLFDKIPEAERCDWDFRDRLMLAGAVLRVVVDSGGFVTAFVNHQAKQTYLVLLPEVSDWLNKSIQAIPDMRLARLPVLHEPLDWVKGQGSGGYMPGYVPMLPFISRASNIKASTQDADPVYSAVNGIQRTPFRVNVRVAEMYSFALAKELNLDGLIKRAGPKPERPNMIEDPKGWQAANKLVSRWHDAFAAEQDAVADTAKTLSAINWFKNKRAFWWVNTLDFRGRVYPASSGGLSPQGPKHQRAMLEFARGVRLGKNGLRALRHQAANTWGEDKLSLEGRQQWAIENEELILSVGEDAKSDLRWTQADDPWGFLAVCFDIYAAQEEGEDYVSHLPVNYDGSSNGLQILSLALRDPVGAEATNCAPCETPNDIYAQTGAAMVRVMREWVDSDRPIKQRQAAKKMLKWLDQQHGGIMPRAYMKRATMTTPYSATDHSIQGYMSDVYLEEVKDLDLPEALKPFGKETFNVMRQLVPAFHEGLSQVVVKGFELMKYLRQMAEAAAEHNVHIEWTTPLGLKVRQVYWKPDTRMAKVTMPNGRRTVIRYNKWKPEVYKSRAINGAVPNWVHSLDAAALQATVNVGTEAGIEDWLCIHDSIGTHAGNTDKLYSAIREGYRSIFVGNVVQDFHESVRRQLPEDVTLPVPPEMGSFNLDNILTADFFFA